MALTHKQQKFVSSYLGEARGNATQAARRAGYEGNDVTLASVGAENLRKPQIMSAIQTMTADLAAASCGTIATADEVLALLTTTARLDEIKPGRIPHIRDATRAQELLGKHHGLWSDETSVTIHAGTMANDVIAKVISVLSDTIPDDDQRHHITTTLLARLAGSAP